MFSMAAEKLNKKGAYRACELVLRLAIILFRGQGF
jgi:hypothetical protein